MPRKIAGGGPVSPTKGTSRATRTRSKRPITFKSSSWYESALRTIAIKNVPPLSEPRVQLWNARLQADAD
jgi:hypothetical protein